MIVDVVKGGEIVDERERGRERAWARASTLEKTKKKKLIEIKTHGTRP